VQLVSVYGTGDDNTNHAPSRSVSVSPLPRAHHGKNYTKRDDEKNQKSQDIQYKVRAFLPRQQILDVIVMEVVWPHCVWSQVAFRVLNGAARDSSSQYGRCEVQGGEKDVMDGMGNGCESNIQNNCDERYKRNNDGSTPQSDQERIQEGSRRSQMKPPSIQELIQKNQVSIVPAFPEECRGMLSYEQCLHIQAEIERLLG